KGSPRSICPTELSGGNRNARRPTSASAAGGPRSATERKSSPSQITNAPNEASQRVWAFSRITSKTGARSPGEELMTCNTWAVAICCSRASRVSVISRAFLHCDDCLGGEVLKERNILIGKGAHFGSSGNDPPQ